VPPRPDEDFFAHRRSGPPAVVDRDRRLALAVVRTLNDDIRTRREGVRVAAQNNVVFLNGTVGSWEVRDTAAALARRTPGAFDLCNALHVDGDAPDLRRADPFAELVASVPEPRPPWAVSRRWIGAGRSGRVMLCVLLLVWLTLLVGMAEGLPALPVLIAGLVATVVTAGLRFAERRASRG
jgi:hypothetical protein